MVVGYSTGITKQVYEEGARRRLSPPPQLEFHAHFLFVITMLKLLQETCHFSTAALPKLQEPGSNLLIHGVGRLDCKTFLVTTCCGEKSSNTSRTPEGFHFHD
jgi:hypothetical protein